jgi:hypothetical protein
VETVSRYLRHESETLTDLAVSHPYEFAFRDWRFDHYGFPSRSG